MKLSVLICVYNTAKEYLAECLDSITRSTLRDYEICMVDDGSTVDYSELVSSYGLKYVKTENRGILSARLRAIEEAEGKYIVFVDSDDTVTVNYHRPMLEALEEGGHDIVYNDWAFRTERSRYFCKYDSTLSGDISAEGDATLARFLAFEGRQHSYSVLWNKMYRREILLGVVKDVQEAIGGIKRFNYSEDVMMNFFAHKRAKSIKNIHTGYYFYRLHSDQSVGVTSRQKLLGHIEQMALTLDVMRRGVLDCSDREILLGHVQRWSEMMSRTHYSYARSGDYTDLYPIIKEKYRTDSLRIARFSDGSVYSAGVIIADNIEEIDAALLKAWLSEIPVTVESAGLSQYARRVLSYMSEHGRDVTVLRGGVVRIPKERRNIFNIIIRSAPVSAIPMLLFPKGSKIRAMLKRRL